MISKKKGIKLVGSCFLVSTIFHLVQKEIGVEWLLYFSMSNNLMPFNLSAAAVGGGVVPEPPRPDQAQADGGGLRVPQALVRAAGRGEPPPQVL